MTVRYNVEHLATNFIRGWCYEENEFSPVCISFQGKKYLPTITRPDVIGNNLDTNLAGFTIPIDITEDQVLKLEFIGKRSSKTIYIQKTVGDVGSSAVWLELLDILSEISSDKIKDVVSLFNFSNMTVPTNEIVLEAVNAGDFSSTIEHIYFHLNNSVLRNDNDDEKTAFGHIIDKINPEKNPNASDIALDVYLDNFGCDEYYLSKKSLILLKKGRDVDCEKLCRLGLNRFPLSADLFWHLSLSLEQQNKLDDAFTVRLMALHHKTTADRVLNTGQLALRLLHGDFGITPPRYDVLHIAQSLLLKSIEDGRRDGLPEYHISQIAFHQKDLFQSLAFAKKALSKNEASQKFRGLLTRLYIYLGEHKLALQVLDVEDPNDDLLFLSNLLQYYGSYEMGDDRASFVGFLPDREVFWSRVRGNIHFNFGQLRFKYTLNSETKDYSVIREEVSTVEKEYLLNKTYTENSSTIDFRYNRNPTVLLVSRYGKHAFGGAERFLLNAASIYEESGFEVRFLGFSGSKSKKNTDDNDDTIYVEENPKTLRKVLLEHKPSIVHSVSGSSYAMAMACRGLKVFHIHGVHFWRDFIYSDWLPNGHTFERPDQLPKREEFSRLLASNGTVYANSNYTAQHVFEKFGVYPSIIPSLPTDNINKAHLQSKTHKGYVLQLNGRANKGGFFTLDIAARLPDIDFVIIASQSDKSVLEHSIVKKNLSNVKLIDRVEDTTQLFKNCFVTIVPSYDFKETFSRIVIEAHRHGKPVIGSNEGNVDKLLQDIGQNLEKDPTIWANEITKLYEDEVYYKLRSKQAVDHSKEWSYSRFESSLKELIKYEKNRILVCVGTGIGNILHTTPLIKLLSIYYNVRVDVALAADSGNSYQIFCENNYVNSIFKLSQIPIAKTYDKIILTNSFASIDLPWNADVVFDLKKHSAFNPASALHEARHNAKVAGTALKIELPEITEKDYFFSNLTWNNPNSRILGIHAGSKGGKWATKQWPYYQELAHYLSNAGWTVESYGAPEEYVEGTINKTGLDLGRSASCMQKCLLFVSNDSGFMNIAAALCMPQIALFGPTNPQTRGPINSKSEVLIPNGCSSCEVSNRKKFDSGKCNCIASISVERVCDLIFELSNKYLK
ncbi:MULTISPECIES: glycosyltransferase family 9 protein [unclassified Roseibium]|uniref:glycosyltransferase family 9 protein n=1 Tax=unclassified Roseibium TaxID=2629323 RepID=UPI00273EE026|nr:MULTISPECIES: glycosyltransferase family 9 protein [unclassified Roseibium]